MYLYSFFIKKKNTFHIPVNWGLQESEVIVHAAVARLLPQPPCKYGILFVSKLRPLLNIDELPFLVDFGSMFSKVDGLPFLVDFDRCLRLK